MGELGHVAVFANQCIVVVGAKMRKRAVEGKAINAWGAKPVRGDAFFAINFTCIGRLGIVRDLVHDPINGPNLFFDMLLQ